MAQYNTLNVKLSYSQINKSGIENDSKDETNFPRKLLLTDTQVSRLHNPFGNSSSAKIKLSKHSNLIWYS